MSFNPTAVDFHPFAEEYPLMPAAELERLTQGMREHGYDPRFPIVTYQGKILDGRNRYLAATDAEVEPVYEAFVGNDEEARAFVELANENRRHLAAEWLTQRRAERIERVAAARREGESLRTIAENEGVSQSTVRGDLEKSTAQGCAVEPEGGKVTGQDGRTRTAKPRKKKPKPGDAAEGEDAPDSAPLPRTPTSPKQPEPRPEMQDLAGNALPDRLRDVFADDGLTRLIGDIEQAAEFVRPQSWFDRAAKLCPHHPFLLIEKVKEHVFNALEALQLATEALQAGLPFAVCPKCQAEPRDNGTCCRTCRGCGYVPETRWKELNQ